MGFLFSVGVVNVFLNSMVLICVSLAGEIALFSMVMLAQLQLRNKGNAPFLYESDGRLWRLAGATRRFWSSGSFGMLTVAFLSASLIVAEVIAELGVDSSTACKPKRLNTKGLCPTFIETMSSRSKAVATAVQTESMKWDNAKLIQYPIRQGFRKAFDGTERFGARDSAVSLPIVISRCSVSEIRQIPPRAGLMTFSNVRNKTIFGIRLKHIVLVNSSVKWEGLGGILDNYAYYSAILVTRRTLKGTNATFATVTEYAESQHLKTLIANMTKAASIRSDASVVNVGPMFQYNVSCLRSALNAERFQDAIYVYRSAQLGRSAKENPYPLANISVKGSRFTVPRPFAASDVVRSVIAAKTVEPISCNGETFVTTTCGTYHFIYILPLTLIFAVLSALALVLVLFFRSGHSVNLPFTAKSWSSFAIELDIQRNPALLKVTGDETSPSSKLRRKRDGSYKYVDEYILTEGSDSHQFEVRRNYYFERPRRKPSQASVGSSSITTTASLY